MLKFTVCVTRYITESVLIEIEANNPTAASAIIDNMEVAEIDQLAARQLEHWKLDDDSRQDAEISVSWVDPA